MSTAALPLVLQAAAGLTAHLKQPLLVVAVPDVDHSITTTSSKGAKQGVVGNCVDRGHHIHTVLCPPVALQKRIDDTQMCSKSSVQQNTVRRMHQRDKEQCVQQALQDT
jgi:hypothetical protein